MIKLKNILAENNNNEVLLRARIALSRHGYTPMVVKNMTREDMIRTLKKLSSDRSNDAELDDIAVKLQGIKTNNLIVPDTDQNNNGYPDSTEIQSQNTNLTVKDFDEYVRPDYVEVTLSNGRKLQIKRKNVQGGAKFYQAVLQALDNYNTNPKAKQFIDGIINAMINNLQTK